MLVKNLKVFSREGNFSFNIAQPSFAQVLAAIERISHMIATPDDCFYAILERDDDCYVQLAVEEAGFHVEWREWGEPYLHWWAKRSDGDDWISKEQTIELFCEFFHDRNRPNGFCWFLMNAMLDGERITDGEIKDFQPRKES